jgi:hypothetical protein
MVTVSSAFISSRRERIRFRVSSAAGRAFKASASVDVLRALDLTVFGVEDLDEEDEADLDNTEAVRDHSFHCIANAESRRPATILRM